MKSAIAAGLAVLVLSGGVARADEDAAKLQSLVDRVAPMVVTVKAVLKTEMNFGGQSRDSESRLEMQGIIVSKSGLVMVSNTPFSPGRLMGMIGGDGPSIKATPSDIKVVFEQEEKEYSAFLAATDTKLDLAFLKIEDLGDRKLMPVEFTNGVTATVGQPMVSISRMPKGYDYAPFFRTGRISGMISKPRKAWMLDGSISDVGMPIFTLNGEVVGVLTTIESGAKNESAGDSMGFGMMMQMMGGRGLLRTFIVPAAVVNGIIGQAELRATTQAAERAKQRAAKTTAKPGTDKPKPKKP